MTDVRIRGAEDIDTLVRQIRTHADAKALRKELYASLGRLSKELRGPMLEVIPTALPKRGGLADLVASRTKMKTTAKSGKYAGVSLRFSARGHDLRLLTGQRLRHPVFGNRNTWVDQTAGVDPAVFTAKFEQQKPEIQAAVVRALENVARKVTA